METADFKNARWIWGEDNTTKDQKTVFRRRFTLEEVPEEAIAYIGAETKYWLWINGNLAVFEGGVFRESKPGCGWADKVDLAPYLDKGENTLAVLVWYYGNGGRNNTTSPEGGFILSCEAIGLYTNSEFVCAKHPAYIKGGEPHPSYLYGGDNIAFDAHLDFGDFTDEDFDEIEFTSATEYENKVWGDMLISPLPLLRLGEKEELDFEKSETGAIASLPYAMTATFSFRIDDCEGGEVIDIRTDRYNVNGGPGDEFHNYNGHRIEYICREGDNEFESLMYLYGEKVYITYPENVTLKKLAYRESGYNSDVVASIETDDPLFDRLIGKCIRTLYVCMRNNFMDCPDRERGQWIGDVSVQAPQVFYVFDERAKKLLKKSITDFIGLRKGDVLVGNVPGDHFSELPSQSLVAISEFGLLAEYYNMSLDEEIPSLVLEPCVNYLKLWSLDERGLLVGRDGNWRWFDHLWNTDCDVLENCLYVSACKFALRMAEICKNHAYDEFLTERAQGIAANVEKYYWKGDHYSSDDHVDDRANAIAMLSGICTEERYPAIRKVLLTVFNSTPYMERFVLLALCKMGYIDDAYDRMMSRYYKLAKNENSTIWEDFYILGTRNHAWSGSPLEIAFRYLLGVTSDDGFKTYQIKPHKGIFKYINASFNAGGKTVCVKVDENGEYSEEIK